MEFYAVLSLPPGVWVEILNFVSISVPTILKSDNHINSFRGKA